MSPPSRVTAKAEQWLLAELSAEEAVLARGTGGERRRLAQGLGSPWDDFFVVTPRRLLLVPLGRSSHRASLEFDAVTSWAEGTQYHYYCLVLRHEPIERMAWAPAHRVLWFAWGDSEETRRQAQTTLNFSRRGTKVATAIREQLLQRGVPASPPLRFEEVPRAERTSSAVLVARRRWRDRLHL